MKVTYFNIFIIKYFQFHSYNYSPDLVTINILKLSTQHSEPLPSLFKCIFLIICPSKTLINETEPSLDNATI